MMSLMQQKIPSQSSDWQARMRLRTLSPALATAYKTEQAPQCLVSTLYFWSATRHLHKMQSCLVFIHRECSLVYHMYNDIKLTIIIARFVVMWYSMPPICIYVIIVSTKSCRSLSTTVNGTCVNATFRNWFVEVM